MDSLCYKKCKVVAEVGNVHLGSLDRAKFLIDLAKTAGADYVKFQKRNPIESVPKEIQNLPHPNTIFSYGKTYLEHRIALELNIDQHILLKEYCESVGIGYSTSVWDLTSAKQIVQINPDFIKIGSPSNNNLKMLNYLITEYTGGLHISLGMSTPEEISTIISSVLQGNSDPSRFVLYHCTSEYPCIFGHLYLKEISRLRSSLPQEIEVGFSNHGYGISSDIAAYTLGSTWIERHFVDDRTVRHTDASFSLEPEGLRRLCRDLNAVYESLTCRNGMTEEEKKERLKLKYRNLND